MRILHLAYFLKWGGMERQMSYLLNELARMGHDIHLAYFAEGLKGGEQDLRNLCLHKIKKASHYDPLIIWRLVQLIRRTNPDVVHSWHYLMDILGGIATRITGTPWIFREALPHLPEDITFKTRLRDWIASGADIIVSNSVNGERYWAKRCQNTHRRVIPNGVPLSEIEKIKAYDLSGLGIKSKQKIILYVGQLLDRKNIHFLIHALTDVRKVFDVAGVLCGDGPERDELVELADKLGITENVYFMGQVVNEQVWALMKSADVFVFLSANEGCPNAVLEAMACGCPLVVSDIPAHKEILDEQSALFMDPLNPKQVTDAILDVLKNEGEARPRALVARMNVKQQSIAAMSRKYEAVYRKFAK